MQHVHQRSALAAQLQSDRVRDDNRLQSLEMQLESLLRRQREERSKRELKQSCNFRIAVGKLRKKLVQRTEFLQDLRDNLGERSNQSSPRVYKEKPRAELVQVAGEVMQMHILGEMQDTKPLEMQSFTAIQRQISFKRESPKSGLNLSLPEVAVLEALEPMSAKEIKRLSTKEQKIRVKLAESGLEEAQSLLKPASLNSTAQRIRENPINSTAEKPLFPGTPSNRKKTAKRRSLLSKSMVAVDSVPAPTDSPIEKPSVSHSKSISEAASLLSSNPENLPMAPLQDPPDSTRSMGLYERMGRYYRERVKPDFSPKVLRNFFPWVPESALEAELRRKIGSLQRIRLQELPKSSQ
jgi:hypothetical protein